MELRTYWKILRRRWWLVITPIIVVIIYIAATYASPPTSYQVVMRFSAGTEPAGLSLDYDRYYPWLTSEYIANGLSDVTETGLFAQNVTARLAANGHELTPEAIQGAIVADNTQSILVVYLTWPHAEQIVPLAKAVSSELTENAASYYPQINDVQPAVRQLDAPRPAPLRPGLRARLMSPTLKLGLSVFIGVGLAFLWHYLDPTVQETKDLEALGWQVLARIPRQR